MAETAVVEVQMPEMGESVTEGTVLEWHVAEGDSVEEGQTVVEVSTDKVDAEIPAPASGTITKLLVEPDETVKVGQTLAEMEAGAEGTAAAGQQPADGRQQTADGGRQTADGGAQAEAAPTTGGDGKAATPVARRVAQALGIDLGAVEGSGVGGKVTKADVLAAADGKGDGAAPAKAAAG